MSKIAEKFHFGRTMQAKINVFWKNFKGTWSEEKFSKKTEFSLLRFLTQTVHLSCQNGLFYAVFSRCCKINCFLRVAVLSGILNVSLKVTHFNFKSFHNVWKTMNFTLSQCVYYKINTHKYIYHGRNKVITKHATSNMNVQCSIRQYQIIFNWRNII